MDYANYFCKLTLLDDFETFTSTKYKYIGQLFFCNLSSNGYLEIRDIVKKFSVSFSWGEFMFKILSPESDYSKTIGFLTLKDNYYHMDVIRRLDGYSVNGMPIRIRANGFTNERFNDSLDVNYYYQHIEVKVFNKRYFTPYAKELKVDELNWRHRSTTKKETANSKSSDKLYSKEVLSELDKDLVLEARIIDSLIELIDDNKSKFVQTELTSRSMNAMFAAMNVLNEEIN